MVRRPPPRPLGRRRTDQAGQPGPGVSDAPPESARGGLEIAAREGRPMDRHAASTYRYVAKPIRLIANQAESHRNSGSRARMAAPRDASSLALGVLRGFAGALEAGLLALLHARVAGQHAVLLQQRPHRQVRRAERPGDTVLDRAGLAGHAAPVPHGADV